LNWRRLKGGKDNGNGNQSGEQNLYETLTFSPGSFRIRLHFTLLSSCIGEPKLSATQNSSFGDDGCRQGGES
jgi:hypothetical protein